MSKYEEILAKIAIGWNTWNARSVLSHVLLPEGFALNICFKEYKAGRYLKESLIGRFQPKTDPTLEYRGGEYVEEIFPGAHAYDGSYTELSVAWRGIEVNIQTATLENDLVILVSPAKNQKYPATLVIESGILWNRNGNVEKDGKVIIANLPNKQVRVYTTKTWIYDPYVATQAPYAAMRMDEEIGVSTGKERTIEEIKTVIELRKQEHYNRKNKYGNLSEVYNAIQSCLAWATIYEPKKGRVLTTISRTWDVDRNFGGYLVAWDVFFHSYLASIDNKELAYANAVEMVKEITEDGFVPFAATGAGYVSLDKSAPPVCSMIIRELYRKYGEAWLLEEVFDDLYVWNKWFINNRQISDGLFAWGSNLYEPVYDHFFELEGVNDIFAASRESGMDNSTMWDDVSFNKEKGMMEYADVGLTSLYIMDCDALSEIADVLDKKAEATELRNRAHKCKNSLKTLWDETTGIFLNKHTDTGKFNYRLSPTNFFPLLTDAVTKEEAERMIREHFYNPDEFWGEWMLPCSTRNDPGYTDQYYWRGRIWGPTNLLAYLGFRRYGLLNAQKDLAEKSKNLLIKEWLEHGHVHENYNADRGVGCDDGTESEKFYTWGGLLGLIALIEAGYMEGFENNISSKNTI